MKILLAYEWCLIGGVEAFMVDLAKVLRERGRHCEFFFFTRGPMERYLPEGIAAHFGDLADCMKLVRERGFDIVHSNSSDWRIGITAVRSVGAKLVVTAHGMVIPGWNSTNCDAFACCSRWQTDEQQQFTDFPVHTVLNGIDTSRFKPFNGDTPLTSPPIVAWVGRGPDMTHKRIDKLAAIAPALRQAGLRIWIADPFGPDEVEKVVPEAARVLRPLAELWEGVPRERLPTFLRQVAASGGCVLSTSIREGLSMALIEAQASGCPVIGPDVRGVNEVINPEHGGVLYPFEIEPERLASLVLATLGDKEKMRWRREVAARYAHEKFGIKRMAEDYMRIYEEALNSEHRPAAGLRVRQWLAPLLSWGEYVERRWTAGLSHYEASRRLAAEGEWELARRAARLSVETCPSLYAKPGRLGHLLRLLLPHGGAVGGHGAVK